MRRPLDAAVRRVNRLFLWAKGRARRARPLRAGKGCAGLRREAGRARGPPAAEDGPAHVAGPVRCVPILERVGCGPRRAPP